METILTDRGLDGQAARALASIAYHWGQDIQQTKHLPTGDAATYHIANQVRDEAVIHLSYSLWWSVPHREMTKDDWIAATAWQTARERRHEDFLEGFVRQEWEKRSGFDTAELARVRIVWSNRDADPVVELPTREQAERGSLSKKLSPSMWPGY